MILNGLAGGKPKHYCTPDEMRRLDKFQLLDLATENNWEDMIPGVPFEQWLEFQLGMLRSLLTTKMNQYRP